MLPINEIPDKLNREEIPGLGNANTPIRVNIINAIAAAIYDGIIICCVSFLKKGRTIKNNEIGIVKY